FPFVFFLAYLDTQDTLFLLEYIFIFWIMRISGQVFLFFFSGFMFSCILHIEYDFFRATFDLFTILHFFLHQFMVMVASLSPPDRFICILSDTRPMRALS